MADEHLGESTPGIPHHHLSCQDGVTPLPVLHSQGLQASAEGLEEDLSHLQCPHLRADQPGADSNTLIQGRKQKLKSPKSYPASEALGEPFSSPRGPVPNTELSLSFAEGLTGALWQPQPVPTARHRYNVGTGLQFSAGQTGTGDTGPSHTELILCSLLGGFSNATPPPSLPCGQYLEVDVEAHPIVPHFDDLVTSSEQVLAIFAQSQGGTGQLVHRGHLRTRNGTSSLS